MTRWPYSEQAAGDVLVWASWAKQHALEHGKRFIPTAEAMQLLDELAFVATGRAPTRREPLRDGCSATVRREPWARELDVAEVAEALDVSTVRVRFLARHGWLQPASRHEGREWRFDAAFVDAAARRRREHGGAAGVSLRGPSTPQPKGDDG